MGTYILSLRKEIAQSH